MPQAGWRLCNVIAHTQDEKTSAWESAFVCLDHPLSSQIIAPSRAACEDMNLFLRWYANEACHNLFLISAVAACREGMLLWVHGLLSALKASVSLWERFVLKQWLIRVCVDWCVLQFGPQWDGSKAGQPYEMPVLDTKRLCFTWRRPKSAVCQVWQGRQPTWAALPAQYELAWSCLNGP